MRHKPRPTLEVPAPAVPIPGALTELLSQILRELSQEAHRAERALFDALLYRHHYLSHLSTVGENLQYLVQDLSGRPLACVLFGAAAWQCRARYQHIGVDAATLQRRLNYITNNTRVLILRWVRVPHLASHLLGRITRRLSADWMRNYGPPSICWKPLSIRAVSQAPATWRLIGRRWAKPPGACGKTRPWLRKHPQKRCGFIPCARITARPYASAKPPRRTVAPGIAGFRSFAGEARVSGQKDSHSELTGCS